MKTGSLSTIFKSAEKDIAPYSLGSGKKKPNKVTRAEQTESISTSSKPLGYDKSLSYDRLWTNSRRHAEYFVARERDRNDGRPAGIWTHYKTFEFPSLALEMYGGSLPTRILLRLYAHASAKAKKAATGSGITLHTRIGAHSEKLRVSRRSVSEAFRQLEQDGFLERLQQSRSDHHDYAGDFRSARISLLYPGKNWTLRSVATDERDPFGVPQGLLTLNEYLGEMIIIPHAFMKKLNKLPDACSRAALLGALRECTDAGNESVLLTPQQWQERSHLSRSDLFKGKRELIDRKLLNYRKGIVTMHDPRTLRPNERWQRRHTDLNWTPEQRERYDYVVSRTAEDTFRVLTAAFPDMGLREAETKRCKWTKGKRCPFCFAPTLCVHLHERIFRCLNGTCNRRGKIYKQLIGQGLRKSFREVVEFCKIVLQPDEKAA